MRVALVTLATRNFLPGVEVLARSLKKNSPVFWNSVEKVLLSPDVEEYDGFRVVKSTIEEYPYAWQEKTRSCACKLKLFNLTEYDKIIFYEADSVCIRPIDAMLDEAAEKYHMMGVRGYPAVLSKGNTRDIDGVTCLCGDGWIVNKRLLTGKFHRFLKKVGSEFTSRSIKWGDMRVLNTALMRKPFNVGELSPVYCFMHKTKLGNPELYQKLKDDIRMIHFTGRPKPWEHGDLTMACLDAYRG